MTIKSTPISPEELIQIRKEAIPPEVFQAINLLIIEKYQASGTLLTYDEIITKIKTLLNTTSKEILEKNWLDIAVYYSEIGWRVYFYKEGQHDSSYPNVKYNQNCFVFNSRVKYD